MALAALIASKLFEMERSKYFKYFFAFPQDKQHTFKYNKYIRNITLMQPHWSF